MGDIKLFRTTKTGVTELVGQSVALEKSLQKLIEDNLVELLGIRFLATEHSTGKTHGGRIDTLGIDENGCPVIVEYKRAINENVINQGLFYLDWLLDHKAEFELLVLKTYGQNSADEIEWSSPRLLCIAEDYTKYDIHAVQQINRNIELLRYLRFGDDLLLLELVNATIAQTGPPTGGKPAKPTKGKSNKYTYISEMYEKASPELKDRYEAVKSFMTALGDDVQVKTLKFYFAFKRIKNFACVEVHNQTSEILIYLKVNPDEIELVEGFSRDVREVGHYGTGDLELRLKSDNDLERAKPLINKSYEAS